MDLKTEVMETLLSYLEVTSPSFIQSFCRYGYHWKLPSWNLQLFCASAKACCHITRNTSLSTLAPALRQSGSMIHFAAAEAIVFFCRLTRRAMCVCCHQSAGLSRWHFTAAAATAWHTVTLCCSRCSGSAASLAPAHTGNPLLTALPIQWHRMHCLPLYRH